MSEHELSNGWKMTIVKGPVAERTEIPDEELKVLRLDAIRGREALANSWAEKQSEEDLIALMSEDANKYGWLVAHSNSEKVQQAVLKAGAANSPETVHYLTLSEHDSVSSQAQELWNVFVEDFPETIYGLVADIFHAHW